MEIQTFLKLFKRRKQTVLSIVLVCLAAATLLTATQPFKYGASSKLLVSQRFNAGTDAYTISQSNNYLAKLLAEVVGSGSFYEEVMNSGYNVDPQYFTEGNTKREAIEKWRETVHPSSPQAGSGIIDVEVYHPDNLQTGQIAQAVNYILKTQHQEYHGLGGKVFLKTLDRPLVSEKPVKPDIVLIFPVALLLGLFLAGVYIYFYPEDKYDIKVFPSDLFQKRTAKEGSISEKKIFRVKDKTSPERRKKDQKYSQKSSPQTTHHASPAEEKQESVPIAEEESSFRQEDTEPQEESVGGENRKEKVLVEETPQEQEEEYSPAPGEEQKKDTSSIEEKGNMRNIFGE